MKLLIEDMDVPFVRCTWSGHKGEAARKLQFELVERGHDQYYPMHPVKLEAMVQLVVEEKEVFRGYVMEISRSAQSRTIQYLAYDGAFYLVNSETSKTYIGVTPQQVTREVCDEVGVAVDQVLEGDPYDRVHDADNIYEIIMTGYTIQSIKDGKQYMLRMDKGAVNIILQGDYTVPDMLLATDCVSDASYTESITDAVTRVKVFDEQRNVQNTYNLEEDNLTGIIQKAVQQEDTGDMETKAKEMLQGIKKTASIDGIGRIDCITGNAVVIKESVTGLAGRYFIDGDSHTFENGKHSMQLDIAFENIMDKHLSGDEKDQAPEGGGTGDFVVGDTGSATMYNWLRAHGFSAAAAAGIIANAASETGETFDPKIRQGGVGPGTGLFQWEDGYSGRWNLLTAWAAQNGKDPWTIDTQMEYMLHEMESYGMFKSVGGVEGFKKLTDPIKACDMFQAEFEKAGSPGMAGRYAHARKYFDMYKQYKQVPRQSSAGGMVGDGNFPAYNRSIDPANGGAWGHCTWYMYNRYYQLTGKSINRMMGNGGQWASYARAAGMPVNRGKPFPGAAMCQAGGMPYAPGGYGHISFVERVNPDGSVDATGMWSGDGVVHQEHHQPQYVAQYEFIDVMSWLSKNR
ncbi:MAG: phage tail tip lysozyme [Clostridiales bacterium]|nr:phage tail tip lysozyme [Clostridiales bacterium]